MLPIFQMAFPTTTADKDKTTPIIDASNYSHMIESLGELAQVFADHPESSFFGP